MSLRRECEARLGEYEALRVAENRSVVHQAPVGLEYCFNCMTAPDPDVQFARFR